MAKVKVTFKLDGMEALQRAIVEAPKEAKRGASDAVRQTTWAIADKMRQRAPVRSGTLLSSIDARVPVLTGLTGSVEINGDAYYWRFLEYGTVNMRARPFIRPSGEEEQNPFIERLRDVGNNIMRAWRD